MTWLMGILYLKWGPVVVLAPTFRMDICRSQTYSKTYGEAERQLWLQLSNEAGVTPLDTRKLDAAHAVETLMAAAFDRSVGNYVRSLLIKLMSYDTASRELRRTAPERTVRIGGRRAFEALNARNNVDDGSGDNGSDNDDP